jgi:lecithin:retinol acyltransferase
MKTILREVQSQDRQICYRAPSMPHDHALDADHEPSIGAHMVTRRWGYTHHGIYVGRGRVVQYGGLSLGLRRGPVEEVTLSQFSLRRAISIRSLESTSLNREEVVRRARSRLGENRYHVLRNNCEHFCEWCVSGEHRSYQVDQLIAAAPFLRILHLR